MLAYSVEDLLHVIDKLSRETRIKSLSVLLPVAKLFYDLNSVDKMVVNLATCTKRAKSLSHVERGDDI